MKHEKKPGQAPQVRQPLFTGKGSRDASVAEFEKAAEASFAIRELIEKLRYREKDE